MTLNLEDTHIRFIMEYWNNIIYFGNYYFDKTYHNHKLPKRIEEAGFTYEIHNEEGYTDTEAKTYKIIDLDDNIVCKINIVTDIITKELSIGFFIINNMACHKDKWESFLDSVRKDLLDVSNKIRE